MSPKQPTAFVLQTVLPLVLIYSVAGNIAFFPTFLSLFFLFLIEALHIFNNVTKRLNDEELQRLQKLRENEIALITARITKEIHEQTEKEMELLKRERALAEAKRSEDFTTIMELIYKEGAIIQALVREEEQKARREADCAKVKDIREAATGAKEIQDDLPSAVTSIKEKVTVVEAIRKRSVADTYEKKTTTNAAHDRKPLKDVLPGWVIELDPRSGNFTCIGNKKDGGRCTQKMISGKCKDDAATRLKIMRSSDPGNTFSSANLLELADWMLCPRWHKTGKNAQVEKIASAWYRELQPARDALSTRKVSSKLNPPIYTFSGPTSPSRHSFDFTPPGAYSSSATSLSSASTVGSSQASSRGSSSYSLESYSSNSTSPSPSPSENRQKNGTSRLTLDDFSSSFALGKTHERDDIGAKSDKGRVYLTPAFEAMGH
jgi:hypothetical protein